MNKGRESNPEQPKATGDLPTQDAPARRRTGDLELLAPTKTRATDENEKPKPSPPPERLPTQFGRYRLIRELGRGGMGAVVLAEDTQLGRQVALKIPFLNSTSDVRTLKRFAREAKAAAALSHPNLCAVYDFGTFGKHHYLSMAYIEGRPLQSYLSSGTMIPQRTAAAIIKKAASALEHAHQRGVIHRDLKPSNIMIEPNLGPVVTDFGLARCRDDDGEPQLTQDGVAIGTPSYMSPEQLDSDSSLIGPQSDVFSLGLILYEMLTGERRFQGKVASIIGQILTKDPVSLREIRPDVDPLLDQVCRKMMARDPAQRYSSMGEVANVMRAYLKGRLSSGSGQPVTAEIPSDPELFFAGLAASEQNQSLPPSTQAGGGFGETEPDLVPAIWISEGDSRSSHILSRRERPERSRKTIIATALALLIVAGLIYWTRNPADEAASKVAINPPPGPSTAVSKPEEPVVPAVEPTNSENEKINVPQPTNEPAQKTGPAGLEFPLEDDPEPAVARSNPMPIPEESLSVTEPTPSPEEKAAEKKPPLWLNDAKGKLEFQVTVTKTISGSTTEKKYTIPRSALTEVLKLEQRQQQQDKSLEKVRVLISLNGNAFEFSKAKDARIAAAAFEDAVPHNIPVEDILARLKRLNPEFIEPPAMEPTSEDIERFGKEFQTIYDSVLVPFMSRINNGRGPLSQADIDLAQVRFEQECQKIKGLPESYPIPQIRYRFLPAGALNPNLVTWFIGDSLRYKDQTPKGQLIKRIAEALNAGTLIDQSHAASP